MVLKADKALLSAQCGGRNPELADPNKNWLHENNQGSSLHTNSIYQSSPANTSFDPAIHRPLPRLISQQVSTTTKQAIPLFKAY